MAEENKNKEPDNVSKSELSDLLCELKKTATSFNSDFNYAVRMESPNTEFLKGRVIGAEHIIAIFERYISTIT